MADGEGRAEAMVHQLGPREQIVEDLQSRLEPHLVARYFVLMYF